MQKSIIKSLNQLSMFLGETSEELNTILDQASNQNSWFTQTELSRAIKAWADLLAEHSVSAWLSAYSFKEHSPKRIGLILAGNIPMVGFHDVISVLASGHIACIKLSSQDSILIPALLKKLISFEPSLASQIEYPDKLNTVDAIIATGSTNTANHFEQYFKHIPRLIRKNRTSIAILNEDTRAEDIGLMGLDIFSYYGQGCRNISKVYIPRDYDITFVLNNLQEYQYVIDHHKYYNNYNYYKSIYLVNREEHFDTGFLIFKESDQLQTALSVLYYEYYESLEKLEDKLNAISNNIQCIVSNTSINTTIPQFEFGQSQCPALNDYADGVDTLAFLQSL